MKRKYQWTPDAWNETYPIGMRVRVTSVAAHDGKPAVTFDSVTRSKCWALGDGNPVVLVEGKTGGYSVEPGWMTVLVDDPIASRERVTWLQNELDDANKRAKALAQTASQFQIDRDDYLERLTIASRAIKNAVDLLGPEYCDDGKPLESLRRALDEMETSKEQVSHG